MCIVRVCYYTNMRSLVASRNLSEAQAVIDALLADDDRGPVPGEELVALTRLESKIGALKLRMLRRFERDGGPALDGSLSTVAWLRYRCRMTPAAAGAAVRSARVLPFLPACREALEAGDISTTHAAVITKCAQAVGIERFDDGDRILTDLARNTDPRNLSHAARYLRSVVDPDGAADEYERNHDRRWVHLSQMLDGMFAIQGQLDAEAGVALKTALDALMPPRTPDDKRTAAQRRADALEELAIQRLNAGDLPTSGGQKPHLVVLSTDLDLSGLTVLAGAGPIPREAAERLACDAVAAINGQPERRTFSPSLRRAVEFISRHCDEPGCDAPVGWCDGHHVVEWRNRGKTVLGNAKLYCRRHHRIHHQRERSTGPP